MKSNFNLNLAFLLVFFTTTSFTLLSGGCSVWLSSNELSPQRTRVFETCNTTWNMGIGAIFGLLGSKAAELLETEQDDKAK